MQTTHSLPFLSAVWHFDPEWQVYKVGTCNGQWRCTGHSYEILSILNDEPGNGHTKDVFEWFEASCKRDGKTLKVLEVMNNSFALQLQARGFRHIGGSNYEKAF